jgi:hypothetical protein
MPRMTEKKLNGLRHLLEKLERIRNKLPDRWREELASVSLMLSNKIAIINAHLEAKNANRQSKIRVGMSE